jgi:hypothetical protein
VEAKAQQLAVPLRELGHGASHHQPVHGGVRAVSRAGRWGCPFQAKVNRCAVRTETGVSA